MTYLDKPSLDELAELASIEDAMAHSDNIVDIYLAHYGVKGMKWGIRKDDPLSNPVLAMKAKLFSVAVRFAPREIDYKFKRAFLNPGEDDRLLAEAALRDASSRGVLANNKRLSNAIEKVGIEKHKQAVYDLDKQDLDRLKKYTDAAWYSRSVNGYLATGDPAAWAKRSAELKETIGKNRVSDTTVFRSTSLNFSFNGVAKKLETMSEEELAASFDSFSKNYKGKTFKENRVFSTSTSPNFAIDTWREVNPNAAANYNTYMIINTKNTPGILADGRTTKGEKIVNTRSNQEGILAPTRMKYESLAYDKERGMFAITVTAMGDD